MYSWYTYARLHHLTGSQKVSTMVRCVSEASKTDDAKYADEPMLVILQNKFERACKEVVDGRLHDAAEALGKYYSSNISMFVYNCNM